MRSSKLNPLSLSVVVCGALCASTLYAAPAQPAKARPAAAQPAPAPAQKPAPKKASIDELQDRIDELEDRLDAVELDATLSKVKFGLDFTTQVNNFFRQGNIAGLDNGNQSLPNNWATALYLNMEANINDRLKFYGRLSVTKNWGDYTWVGIENGSTLSTGRDATGGHLVFLERAYADLHIVKERLIATIGRQPATEGPGSNLRQNSARMSTYPALLVNTQGDAIVLTYKPIKSYPSLALRAGYGKIYQYNTQWNSPTVALWSNNISKETNLYYVSAEGKLPLGKMGDNTLIVSYVKLTNLLAATPNTAAGFNNGVVVQPESAGSPDNLNVHFENNNMFGLGTNWFVSYGLYNGTPNSNATPIIAQPPTSPRYATYNGVAHAVHFGIRQDFRDHIFKTEKAKAFDIKLGYEFFYGSEGWYALSRSNINDPLNFRNTQGTVHDVYLLMQFSLNSFLRLSYTYQHHDYLNGMINPSTQAVATAGAGIPYLPTIKADRTVQNIALTFNARF
ncbi:hypothetical protein BKN38_04385 [Helicobacter sp. CLO-3]|uniref:DUF3373 family protein n=1 Tax=unclassified Helicobacter TaxID=2593540 RepID=UPI0008056055|nr:MULTISPECIES: DUF3373 family protein [unclassified Helicobacter]OBV29207.1 hypothetical protein BA723_01045 [Helicobacter sp. CLO-3]OHU84038.1 hypothetical protein BKN38_04385 [Helicobacter sp. CLO-3]